MLILQKIYINIECKILNIMFMNGVDGFRKNNCQRTISYEVRSEPSDDVGSQ